MKATNSSVEFGLIPSSHWEQPEWIDEDKASAARTKMAEDGVFYGGQSPIKYFLDPVPTHVWQIVCLTGVFVRVGLTVAHEPVQKYVPFPIWGENVI